MTAPKSISPETLLWTELFLLWAASSYAIAADPLKEEAERFRWRPWIGLLFLRFVLSAGLSYVLGGSVLLSTFFAGVVLFQPLMRSRLPMRWVAEIECTWVFAFVGLSAAFIRHFRLLPHWRPSSVSDAQASAVCVAAAIFIFIVRGGTYIVRGILRKAGTLPSQRKSWVAEVENLDLAASESPELPLELAVESAEEEKTDVEMNVDVEELNRGRLIGNLERIVLTIVVAAGSYSALGFLVAAKGLVRFEEFEKSREFTEYFLVGSLSSVLVALCAGLILRHALLMLWPELLAFQMQS
jgi:hypothetical protein